MEEVRWRPRSLKIFRSLKQKAKRSYVGRVEFLVKLIQQTLYYFRPKTQPQVSSTHQTYVDYFNFNEKRARKRLSGGGTLHTGEATAAAAGL